MTIDDAKARFLANRGIADPVARAADKEALVADVAAEWGEDKVNLVFFEVVNKLQQEGPV
jgi:hypothetical protein